MRIIKTELFFAPGQVVPSGSNYERLSGGPASVCFAWIKTDLIPPDRVTQIEPEQVPAVIDAILRKERPAHRVKRAGPFAGDSPSFMANRRVVDFVMDAPIVVEQSPPEWVTLAQLLKSGMGKNATPILAVYLALHADTSLFISLPGAFLLVASTEAVAKWAKCRVPQMLDKATEKLWR